MKDNYWSEDKFKHFYLNLAITNILYSETKFNLKLDDKKVILISCGIPISLSISKEIVDKKRKNNFSIKDLIWDIKGILCGLYINTLL
ncbi:MAG: hypothetical protein ABDH49_04780 [Candidatus Hydrothermales bacterium]